MRILREEALLGAGQEIHKVTLVNTVEYREWKQQKNDGVHLRGTGDNLKVLFLC